MCNITHRIAYLQATFDEGIRKVKKDGGVYWKCGPAAAGKLVGARTGMPLVNGVARA